jgi:hypothetical protein
VVAAGSLVVLDLAMCLLLAWSAVLPPAAPASNQPAPMSQRESFEARARAVYDAPLTAPTSSVYMSPVSFRSQGLPANAAVKAGHAVWLVTVHAANGCGHCTLERPTRLHRVYSVVYDATTGRKVDSCGGCEWVKESRPETAVEHVAARAPSWLQNALVRLLFGD